MPSLFRLSLGGLWVTFPGLPIEAGRKRGDGHSRGLPGLFCWYSCGWSGGADDGIGKSRLVAAGVRPNHGREEGLALRLDLRIYLAI